jgi:hypothetical protein
MFPARAGNPSGHAVWPAVRSGETSSAREKHLRPTPATVLSSPNARPAARPQRSDNHRSNLRRSLRRGFLRNRHGPYVYLLQIIAIHRYARCGTAPFLASITTASSPVPKRQQRPITLSFRCNHRNPFPSRPIQRLSVVRISFIKTASFANPLALLRRSKPRVRSFLLSAKVSRPPPRSRLSICHLITLLSNHPC